MLGFLKQKLKSFFQKRKEEVKQIEEEIKEEKTKEEKIEEKKQEEKTKKTEKEKDTKEIIEKKKSGEKEKEKTIAEIKLEEKEKPKEKKRPLLARLKYTKISEEVIDKWLNELELILLQSNVGIEAIDKIKENVKQQLLGKEVEKNKIEEEIKQGLKQAIKELFAEPFDLVELIKEKIKHKKPFVIVFFGINGSGKTTTIAKIAKLLQDNGITCVLAASDTFRAASIEQLQKHAEALNIKMIKHNYGADPAAVAFDAIKHAETKGKDVVLIDTAGRMHTQANLMEEMKKICRVAKPDLHIFVGEAITGNDVIEQAKRFNEQVGIDAIILTKFDVDEKGGAAISISYITGKPIIFFGTGQKYEDLEKFNVENFINKLFEE